MTPFSVVSSRTSRAVCAPLFLSASKCGFRGKTASRLAGAWPLSPETQWIFERPEAADGETYGRWRWVVTPSETGQRRLQVIIAARSIDKNGLVGDTALPDQVITVRVRMNVLRSLGRGIQWLAAMILGGILTEIALIGMRILEK
jgi:hypothetical protein